MTERVLHKSRPVSHTGARAAAPSGASVRRGWRVAVPGLARFAVDHLLLLPVGAVVALFWANTYAESYFRFTYAIRFAVNDVAMAFFFGLITKEVVEATAPGGVLHPWRRAALPFVASFGAVIVPAVLLVGVSRTLDEPMLAVTWLVPAAVDLALCYVVARLIFRAKHAAVPFLLLLGISANALGLAALTVLYPTREPQVLTAVALMTAAIAGVVLLRRARVSSFWPYVLGAGSVSWLALFFAGSHPALALVPVVALMPHARRDPGFFAEASPRAHDPLNNFERWWTHPVQFVLFFFALINAGVQFRALEWGALALPIASLLGRPAGVAAGVALALALGLHLPSRIGWRELTVLGFISSLGFTFALFFATSILGAGQLLAETRTGVLLTLSGGLIALAVARLLHVGRFAGSGTSS
jgi:NhaA family Na+:H+ antiporter